MTRQEQAAKSRQEILLAVDRLLDEKEFQKLTIAEIAREAGVSVGLIYYYFPSKEEILTFDYFVFDRKAMEYLAVKSYPCALDAIRELIFQQTHRVDFRKRNLMAQSYRAQLNQKEKTAFRKDRGFHILLRRYCEQAIAQGELEGDTEEIVETILRVSRGALFDWSMRDDEKKGYENTLHDLERIFISYGMPKDAIPAYPIEEWDKTAREMLKDE